MAEGTVSDYYRAELERIPAHIKDSPYRDFLKAQLEDAARGEWAELTYDPDSEPVDRLEEREI